MESNGQTPGERSNVQKPQAARRTVSRITLLEVLIALASIAALIAWLPKEWNR